MTLAYTNQLVKEKSYKNDFFFSCNRQELVIKISRNNKKKSYHKPHGGIQPAIQVNHISSKANKTNG